MRTIVRIIIAALLLLVLAYAVLFTLQNTATVPLDLLFIQFPEQRLALWLLLAFIVGGVLGMLASGWALFKLRADRLLLRRKLDKLQRQQAARGDGASVVNAAVAKVDVSNSK